MNHSFAATRWDRLLASLPMIACLLGCADSPPVVTGTVTLDGKPLTTGVVQFNAGRKHAGTASIAADGSYRVIIDRAGSPASGEFSVSVTAREPSTPHPQGGPPTPGDLLTPQRYADAATSGLRFTLHPGENAINIKLESTVADADLDSESADEDAPHTAPDAAAVTDDEAANQSAEDESAE